MWMRCRVDGWRATRLAEPWRDGRGVWVRRRSQGLSSRSLVHFSVMSNHLHLIAEAEDRRALCAVCRRCRSVSRGR
jgi:hypothetical protein